MARKKAKATKDDEIPPEAETTSFKIDLIPDSISEHLLYKPASEEQSRGVTPNGDAVAEQPAENEEEIMTAKLDKGKGRAVEVDPSKEELEALEELQADEVDGVDRYYADTSKVDKTHQCSLCNEYGHSIRDCTHQQCTTCGALDDHSFKSCPFNKTCYRCGAKGHIDATCPNPQSSSRSNRCSKCNSTLHNAFSCPSNWRVYEYRSSKTESIKPTLLACYNCGASGPSAHYGAECPIPRGHPLHHIDLSAFTNGEGPPASASQPARNKGRDPFGMSSAPTGAARRPNIVNGVRQRSAMPPKPQSSRNRSPPLSYTRPTSRPGPASRPSNHSRPDYHAISDDEGGQDLINRISKRAYPARDAPTKKPKIAISFQSQSFEQRRDDDRPRRRDSPPPLNRFERRERDRREERDRMERRPSPPRMLPRRLDRPPPSRPSAPNWQKFKDAQIARNEERDRRDRRYVRPT